MNQTIFESLLRVAEKDSDYSENEIAFKATIGEYHIHFYSKDPFNTLRTHEFGYTYKGEWVSDKPTPYQVEQMMQLIQLEVPDFCDYLDGVEKDKEEAPYIDPYEEYGVSRKDFF